MVEPSVTLYPGTLVEPLGVQGWIAYPTFPRWDFREASRKMDSKNSANESEEISLTAPAGQRGCSEIRNKESVLVSHTVSG